MSELHPQPQQGDTGTQDEWRVLYERVAKEQSQRISELEQQLEREHKALGEAMIEIGASIRIKQSLKQQRDELLAALESIVSFATVYVARHDSTPHNRAKIAAARTAIANATK